MALIDPVKALCKKLNLNSGWKALLAKHGLDVGVANLAKALGDPLTIDRSLLGFGDFANDGVRAIEPGSPSRSLFFHAVACPNVLQDPNGVPLDLFPTPAELDAVENYIFGVQKLKLTDVIAKFPGKPFAVVVFACEYRPAPETTHRQHADMVFSRTGNARVGSRPARYVPEFRGFHPEVPAEPFGIAVSPARYAAYLAVQLLGSAPEVHRMGAADDGKDPTRKFWVPVHKLFPGAECLDGLNLVVNFKSSHLNEKIFRAQKLLGNNPPDAPPFRIRKGLAELSMVPDLGPGWIVPVVHPHLVEEAKDAAGKDVTFLVPNDDSGSWATVDLWSIFNNGDAGPAPEYLHARTEVLPDGTRRDLNQFNAPSASFPQDLPVDERVRKGGYKALHYVDFTADGFVDAACSQVQGAGGVSAKSVPAYSIVAAPDFFPATGQRELVDWVNSNAVPDKVRFQVWGQDRPDTNPPRKGQPESLNNQRFPANLQLPGSPFVETDRTITAIVGLPQPNSHSPAADSDLLRRYSHLPDDAAGVFAPGWEVSIDFLNNKPHLAAYGLGSPFPEDSKLCAALSSFWPAVAPDVTRTMDTADANLSGTVIPMTDAEIGQTGGLPWDGVPGPVEVAVGGAAFAEYNSFVHADYVRNALADKFSLRLTSKVDFKAYTDRIFGMLCGYLALGVERTSAATNPALSNLPKERDQWIVLSFKELAVGDPELTRATLDTGVNPNGSHFRATIFRATNSNLKPIPFSTPANFRKRQIPITGRIELILAPTDKTVFLKKPNELKWRLGVVKFV
ncbi:MAG: hypothetical protein HY290_15070 [Planctomycetia bacterium]|nr:hypothetical protein [Planctomycetia bacterium]